MSKDTKIQKHNPRRFYYFRVEIHLFPIGPKRKFWDNQRSLIEVLKTNLFLTQNQLETGLYNLKLTHRNKIYSLKDFGGQLEWDSKTNLLFWNLFIETKCLMTRRFVGTILSKTLYANCTELDPTIKVIPLSEKLELDKQKRYLIPNSEWYPGYFSKEVLKVMDELKRPKIQVAIKETPAYRTLISNLLQTNH